MMMVLYRNWVCGLGGIQIFVHDKRFYPIRLIETPFYLSYTSIRVRVYISVKKKNFREKASTWTKMQPQHHRDRRFMSLLDNIREAKILIHILIKHANLLFPEK